MKSYKLVISAFFIAVGVLSTAAQRKIDPQRRVQIPKPGIPNTLRTKPKPKKENAEIQIPTVRPQKSGAEATELYKKGIRCRDTNLSQAMEYFLDAAEKGNTDAMVEAARIYQRDKTYKNPSRAFELYKEAANNGNARGMGFLSQCYRTGTGTSVNPQLAFQWAEKSAALGCDIGYNALAKCYLDGIGVAKDEDAAIEFYRHAAAGKNANACYNLGVIYENRPETLENVQQALTFYTLAEQYGLQEASERVREMRDKKQKLAPKPVISHPVPAPLFDEKPNSPAESINNGNEVNDNVINEVVENEVVENNKPDNSRAVGVVNIITPKERLISAKEAYYDRKDYTNAYNHLKPLKDSNFADLYDSADLNLAYKLWGLILLQRNTNPNNLDEAIQFLCQSMDGYNDIEAAFYLAGIYSQPNTKYTDLKQAEKCYKLGAKSNDADCLFELGRLYFDQRDNKNQAKKALDYLNKAKQRFEELKRPVPEDLYSMINELISPKAD